MDTLNSHRTLQVIPCLSQDGQVEWEKTENAASIGAACAWQRLSNIFIVRQYVFVGTSKISWK